MSEIKPCPFCVGGVQIVDQYYGAYVVECGGCGCLGPRQDTESEAISAWNRRPTP